MHSPGISGTEVTSSIPKSDNHRSNMDNSIVSEIYTKYFASWLVYQCLKIQVQPDQIFILVYYPCLKDTTALSMVPIIITTTLIEF